MKIEYFGHSCFRLTSLKGTSVVTDPYCKVGYELPEGLDGDIVTVSHGHFDHNHTQAVACSKIVSDLGPHVISDVKISGVKTYHDPRQGALRGENTVYKIEMDGMTVCHFGDLGEPFCEDTAKKLTGADVWLIPIGGTYTIDAKQAIEYIERLAPKAVIPMHYRPNDGALNIASSEEFLNEISFKAIVSGHKTEINKEDLKAGETKVYYMER